MEVAAAGTHPLELDEREPHPGIVVVVALTAKSGAQHVGRVGRRTAAYVPIALQCLEVLGEPRVGVDTRRQAFTYAGEVQRSDQRPRERPQVGGRPGTMQQTVAAVCPVAGAKTDLHRSE